MLQFLIGKFATSPHRLDFIPYIFCRSRRIVREVPLPNQPTGGAIPLETYSNEFGFFRSPKILFLSIGYTCCRNIGHGITMIWRRYGVILSSGIIFLFWTFVWSFYAAKTYARTDWVIGIILGNVVSLLKFDQFQSLSLWSLFWIKCRVVGFF